MLNELNGLDQQLAVLDTELSQKEGLATQLHRQLAGVRERLARQGRGPSSGLPPPRATPAYRLLEQSAACGLCLPCWVTFVLLVGLGADGAM